MTPPGEAFSDPVSQAEALLDSGRPDEAVALLGALLGQGGGGTRARILMGRARLARNETNLALEVLRDASRLAPGVPDAALAHGEALLAAEKIPDAIAELQRALRLAPGWDAAQYALGAAWAEAGEDARARDHLLPLAQSDSSFAHRADAMLNRLDAAASAPRAAPNYVRHLFDQFADNYDSHMLDTLSYRANEVLRELAAMVMGVLSPRSCAILDLGCGTGLAGESFRDLAARLDGIDLSPAMLEKARARGIYTTLTAADLETALASPGAVYNLVLAADTLVYLGDLAPVFRGAATVLASGGFFLFTVERLPDGVGYALGPKRRYRHGEAYLRREAAEAGFDVVGLLACVPRREAGMAVDGFAVALRRN